MSRAPILTTGTGSRPSTASDSNSWASSSSSASAFTPSAVGAPPIPKEANFHQPSERCVERYSTCSRVRKEAALRSSGVEPPAAAPVQAAARNSSVVETRSNARLRIFSGSDNTTSESLGIISSTGIILSTSAGASDSMPSTAMPTLIFSSISAAPGSWSRNASARSLTRSVSSSSRQGGAHKPCSATSSERWSATANQRISSTSSPQNSTRSG